MCLKLVCYPEDTLRNRGLNSHDDLITLQTHEIIIFVVRNHSDFKINTEKEKEKKNRAERII